METKNKHSILKIPLMLLMCVVLLSFGVSAASAAGTSDNSTIYVSTGGNDIWDGLNATYNGTSGPKKTITNATGTVAVNGTVHITQGTYNESGININNNMTITGENQDNTIINGQQSGTSIFYIGPGITVTITNLTLTNSTVVNGGAISNEGNLTVTNSKLTGNTASYGNGGAIYNDYSGNLTVCNSTLTNNIASYGGVIYNWGTLSVCNSTLTNNTATGGGAIYNDYSGNLTVCNSTLTNNTASYGGVISNWGTLSVCNSTLANNTASYGNGGAIYNDYSGNLTVCNSTLTNNTAAFGGVIYNWGTLSVCNSTLTNNTAAFGGVIYNWGTLSVCNSTLANNTASLGSAIYNEYGVIDAKYNWWGSNNPVWTDLLYGMSNPINWLYMTINATPTIINNIINNTQSSLVTVSFNNIYDGATVTSFDPSTGHILDGTLVTYSSTLGSFNHVTATTVNGIATTLFTANHAGTGNLNATTDNQTVTQLVTVNPVSYLYLNTTTSNKNPTVGDTFIVTYKLGNNGPDNATNVTVSFQIPSGLEFVSVSVDNGIYTYNPNNRTITWTLSNVAVGDPYLYLTVRASEAGSYTIIPMITSETFNQNTGPLVPFTFNVQAQNNSNNSSNNTVNAASTTKTVPMQTTGMPIAGLILAILAVLGGTLVPRKK